jgi:hypothetical protein
MKELAATDSGERAWRDAAPRGQNRRSCSSSSAPSQPPAQFQTSARHSRAHRAPQQGSFQVTSYTHRENFRPLGLPTLSGKKVTCPLRLASAAGAAGGPSPKRASPRTCCPKPTLGWTSCSNN